ncbi:MAG: hypothetical protein HYW78_02995 [Parcubacteria group bacterium]|nr:hypothetical protein [Parcubacteria group bacterium]
MFKKIVGIGAVAFFAIAVFIAYAAWFGLTTIYDTTTVKTQYIFSNGEKATFRITVKYEIYDFPAPKAIPILSGGVVIPPSRGSMNRAEESLEEIKEIVEVIVTGHASSVVRMFNKDEFLKDDSQARKQFEEYMSQRWELEWAKIKITDIAVQEIDVENNKK